MSIAYCPCGQPVPNIGKCQSPITIPKVIPGLFFYKGITNYTLRGSHVWFGSDPRKTASLWPRRKSRRAGKAQCGVHYKCVRLLETFYINDLDSRRWLTPSSVRGG